MSQYLLSLLIFVVNNCNQFLIYPEICNISTIVLTLPPFGKFTCLSKESLVFRYNYSLLSLIFSDNSRTFKSVLKIMCELLLFIKWIL
jgi:hypothetical protein